MIIQLSLAFFFTQHHSHSAVFTSRFVLLEQSCALIYFAAFFILVSLSLRLEEFNSDDLKSLHGEKPRHGKGKNAENIQKKKKCSNCHFISQA